MRGVKLKPKASDSIARCRGCRDSTSSSFGTPPPHPRTDGPRLSCAIFVLLSALTAGRPVRVPAPFTVFVLSLLLGTLGCSSKPGLVLTDQLEARRLGANLQVQFTMTADAANRAVMADTDDTSKAAAEEAMKARQQVDRDIP